MNTWQDEFSKEYVVPIQIEKMVEKGILEDMSWKQDPCPSFGAKLRDKNWVRLWIEHPHAKERHGWQNQYTVVIQPDPAVVFGWRMASTDRFSHAFYALQEIIRVGGPRWKFKILEAGTAIA
jgi:hypothetical protein